MSLLPRAAGVTPIFKNMAIENKGKSKKEGRPIFEDIEVVELRIPGTKDFSVHPATEFCGWTVDEESGEQNRLTYAEKYARQYKQFKERQHQTMSGTPLDYLPFLTEGKRAELRALSIYTAEMLANLDGQPLKNLGLGGRDLKNKAAEWLASSDHNAIIRQQQLQIEALEAKLRVSEEDKSLLLAGPRRPDPEKEEDPNEEPQKEEAETDDEDEDKGDEEVRAGPNVNPEFVGMSPAQLRAFITEQTGKRPMGNPSMKTLLQMAEAARG